MSTGTQEKDKACAVIVGRLNADYTLSFESIVDAALITSKAANAIVAGSGASRIISVHALAPLQTTTGYLDYLISATDENVYALPLLNYLIYDRVVAPLASAHGTLASIDGAPLEGFALQNLRFAGRHFHRPPTSAADIYHNDNAAAKVGAGPLAAGPVAQLMVQADTVFAIVNNPAQGHAAGIYQSKAMVDARGKIAGWTAWQKTAAVNGIDFATLDVRKGTILAFSGDPQGEKGTRTARVNSWGHEGAHEIALLLKEAQKEFVDQQQEIKKVIDFKSDTPGLRKNYMALLADHKMLLAQFPDFKTFSLADDEIKIVGAPTCIAVAAGKDQAWFCVGGTHGLALLADEHNAGWHMSDGLSDLDQLTGMRCIRWEIIPWCVKLLPMSSFCMCLPIRCLIASI